MKRIVYILPILLVSIGLAYRIPLDYRTIGTIEKSDQYIQERDCKFCHSNIVKHEVLHAPVADDCTVCHQSTGNPHPKANMKGFTLVENEPELCFVCHEQNNVKSSVHGPVKSGKCSGCHSPHGSEYRFLLSKSSPSLSCLSCHKTTSGDQKFLHAPVETDGCASCHDAHQSDYASLLIMEKSDLCQSCHSSIGTEKQLAHLHPPFEDDCANCHNPHGAGYPGLLISENPGLCYACHGDIETRLKDSQNIHSPVHDERSCSNCHSAHASANDNLLSANGMQLCFSCHDKEIESGNRVIANMKEKISRAKYTHAAIETEGCVGCHDPHGTNYTALLKVSFPGTDYVNTGTETFALCFGCHDAAILTEASGDVTGFRNGSKNLHYLHVQGKNGRNCNLCHDVHASGNKHLIKSRTTYGTWDMPMNYRLAENGGSCRTGCHIELSYDRLKQVVYNESNIIENEVNLNITNDTNQSAVDRHPGDTLNLVANESIDTNKQIEHLPIEADTNLVTDIDIPSDTTREDFNPIQNGNQTNENDHKDSLVAVVGDTITHQTELIENETEEINSQKKDTLENITLENPDNRALIEDHFKPIRELTILFDYRCYEPKVNQNKLLEKVIVFMKKYPETRIEIIGHTDETGTSDDNMELSRKRAEAVKKLICDQGILPERIKIRALGEIQPKFSNKEAEGRDKNRRVEFRLQEQ